MRSNLDNKESEQCLCQQKSERASSLMNTGICACIVSYNCDKTIIESAQALSEGVDQILVVDNCSSGESLSIINALEGMSRVTVYKNTRNEGIAAALNRALDYAQSRGYRFLLTMDQDSVIMQDSLTALLQAICLDEKVGAVGPRYEKKLHNTEAIESVNYLITSGSLVRISAAVKCGGYNEDLFVDCVDFDFSFRLIENGYNLLRVGKAEMRHVIGEPERSKIAGIQYYSHNPARFYTKVKNNLYVIRRHRASFPGQCLKLALSLVFEIGRVIVLENNKRQKLKFAAKGFFDGVTTFRD